MNRKTFFKAIAGSIMATFSTIPILTSKANIQQKKDNIDDILELSLVWNGTKKTSKKHELYSTYAYSTSIGMKNKEEHIHITHYPQGVNHES